MTKKLLTILLIVVVAAGAILGFFWWQRSGEGEMEKQIEEQTKPEPTKRVIIPSSLDPKEVVENIILLPRYFESISKEEDPLFLQEFWERYLEISSSGKGIIKYAVGIWVNYIKRNGVEVLKTSEGAPFILFFHVLKYEKPEFAQRDYSKIIFNQKFEVSILEGVKLKTKVGIPSSIREELGPIKPEQFQQYVIQSNNFIIYAVGLKEASEDIMIRLIDRYAVK
ncbi:hypothetical protein KJA17_00080 [Patescibacteria group bacterium]|nr:hypothetical protein [Patescibacteria group bacterium]